MIFRQLFDSDSSTYTYLLGDEESGEAVLIDPVREQVERDLGLVGALGLRLVASLETHVHADHITGSGLLRERTGCRTWVSAAGGAPCADVQARAGDRVAFGARWLSVRETPGHTDGCVSYVLDDESMVFTGDTLLIGGCGRTDFQQGDARRLYRSVHEQLFTLPEACRVLPAHDYKGRAESTIGAEKAGNPRLGGGRTEEEFVGIMAALRLDLPRRIHEAVPANSRCGVEEGARGA